MTDEVLEVEELLVPLTSEDFPLVKCVGMNYMKHIQEGRLPPPPKPQIFHKPRTCVADHNEDIAIPKIAQDNQCNYEGKFCVVIGKTGKDVKEKKL